MNSPKQVDVAVALALCVAAHGSGALSEGPEGSGKREGSRGWAPARAGGAQGAQGPGARLAGSVDGAHGHKY